MQRKSCFRGCLLYGCLTLLVLALPFWYICLYAPPLKISPETTRITGPLTADGQIDYFKALEERIYPPELATDENGFRDFVRLFGFVRSDGMTDFGSFSTPMALEERELHRRQTCTKLGLDPDVRPTLAFPEIPRNVFLDYYKAKNEALPETIIRTDSCCGVVSYRVLEDGWVRPWTLEQFPMFAEWIKEIDEPMDAIVEAIHKPVFFAPTLTGSIFGLYPQIVQILQARANYRIANGDIDNAIDDKLAIYRLGRLTSQEGYLFQYQMGIAFETMATGIPVSTNTEHPPTKKQIQRFLDGLNALPQRGLLADVYEVERLEALSKIQDVKRTRSLDTLGKVLLSDVANNVERDVTFKDALDDFIFATFSVSCNWNVVFRRVNDVYDSLKESPLTTYHSVQEIRGVCFCSHCLPGEFLTGNIPLSSSGRGMLLANQLIQDLLPSVDMFENVMQRAECSENMKRLTLAMLLYQREHGKLPDENWATLIVPYLGENPEQYFSCPRTVSPLSDLQTATDVASLDGKTTYALVQYGDALPADTETILLVELTTPVPFAEAVIAADKVPELIQRSSDSTWRWQNEPHRGGMNLAYRSGAVRWLSARPKEECEKELLRSLGREVE